MNIPVLMYHEIYKASSTNKCHSYAISHETFEKQLKYLKENNYQTLIFEGKVEHNKKRYLYNNKNVVITFDDTQLSNYTYAFPLLKEYGLRAIFFISTSFINQKENLLTEEQIAEMSKNGMSIQSHTHTHAFLNDLDEDRIYSELKTSKSILEDIVKKEVTLLSCPGGRFNRMLLKLVRKAGYNGIFVSTPGIYFSEDDIFVCGRHLISDDIDIPTFENIIRMNRNYIFRKRLESSIKNIARRMLGNNLYHNLWKRLKGIQ